jgi:MFS family permease
MNRNVFLALAPISLSVFVGFLTIGLPLPVLPLHLHNTLGLTPLLIGVVIGTQFVASVFSRAWAGRLADARGPKRAVVTGYFIASLSGLAYLASWALIQSTTASICVLLLGRLLLGCAESLIATGSMSWGIGLVGQQNAGKVMAWTGVSIYAAYAAGAPIGVAVYAQWGFVGISVATFLIPLLAVAIVAAFPGVAPMSARPVPFYKVLGAVWVPGLGLSLCSIGFGVITSFIALLFSAKAWGNASLAFTAFGLAFIGARALFSHLPDKLGGAKVALVCVLIETVGQLLIWGATSAPIAYVGTALTGFGYSLAFPGFGVEAVRRAPPQSRGVAMGAYVACLDISMAITGPLAGAIATRWDVTTVYLFAAIAVALSTGVALRLLLNQPPASRLSTHPEPALRPQV